MLRLLRRLRRTTLGTFFTTASLLWAWRNRDQVASWARFAFAVPRRVRDGEGREVYAEAWLRARPEPLPGSRVAGSPGRGVSLLVEPEAGRL